MDGLGEELLARAALPEQEHRRRARCDLPHGLEYGEDLGALADQVVEIVFVREAITQDLGLLEETLLLEDLLQDHLQLVDVDGLPQVVLGPHLHGPHRGLDRAVGGHEEHHRLGPDLLDLGQQLDAVHAGHAEVGEHDVGVGLLEQGEARRASCARETS